jgi:hypothetical protein
LKKNRSEAVLVMGRQARTVCPFSEKFIAIIQKGHVAASPPSCCGLNMALRVYMKTQ